MRIGADLRWPTGTGIGAVQRELLKRKPDNFEVVDIKATGSIGSPLAPLRLRSALHRDKGLAGFWSPGWVPPAGFAVPAVVTVHDLTHLHHYSKAHRLYYDAILKPLFRSCAEIICVSDYTRNEFLEWAGVSTEFVTTVYNGVSEAYFSAVSLSDGTPPYVLYAGNRRSYKNLDGLIEAYSKSKLPRAGVDLVLTGSPDAKITSLLIKHGVGGHVRFAGYVQEDQMPALYAGAFFSLFLSFYEGFGLPILESMAAGTPVITSTLTSMPEIAGNAAQLVNPKSIDEIVDAINRLADDASYREELIERGRKRAADFSWNKAAQETWTIIQRAVSG